MLLDVNGHNKEKESTQSAVVNIIFAGDSEVNTQILMPRTL
jgi:hypothetical protein